MSGVILGGLAGTGRAISARTIWIATAFLLWTALYVQGSTITKKNNANNLNTRQAWLGGKAPGASDIALWDNYSLTSSLGGNVSWLGIQITSTTGLTTINAGNTLTLGSAGIDMSSAAYNFNINCGIVLGASQTWSITSGKTLASTGVISGTGALTKSGLGTLTLSGVNTYTGATAINAGTLSVSGGSALGAGSAALIINPTGIFQATGTFTSSRLVTLGGTGGGASGGTFDVTGSNIETRTGVISGSGSLTKTGTGTLSLAGANTFTGDLYINGGTVIANSTQALGPQPTAGSSLYATHMANGTTLQTTLISPGGWRQLEFVSGTATLDVVPAATQQRNGLVYGNGGFSKTGAGTLILTGANTYAGGTTVNGGILEINNTTGSATGTGAVAVNSGGTLSGLPLATGFANAGSISGIVSINSGGTLTASSSSSFTFGGLNLNSLSVSNFQIGAPTANGVINVTGTNAFSINGSSTINIMNAGGLAAGIYHLFDYTGTAFANINNLSLGSTPGGGFTYSLSNNQTNSSIDLLVSISNQQWANDASGNWSAAGNWTSGTVPNGVGAQGNFFNVINQARTVTVDGAFTAGSLTFNSAYTYTLASDGVAGHGINLSNSGTANISVIAGGHLISAPLSLTDNLLVSAFAGTSLTISGAISENVAGRTVTSNSAGTVTLGGSSANTYTGLTLVSAGTLNLDKTPGVNAIGAGGLDIDFGGAVTLLGSNQIADSATVINNGTFTIGTRSETVAALNGVGNVITGTGGILTIGSSSNLNSQFDGVISGAGTITKAGTGTFALSGANTFGGAGQTVSVNGGILQYYSDSNLGDSANSVTLNGGTLETMSSITSARAINLSGNGTINTGNNVDLFSGVVSGAGGLTKAGSGTLNLSGTNTFSGGTTINAGTVVINDATSLGSSSGGLSLNAGTLAVAGTFSTVRNITLGSATSSIQVDPSQSYTVNGVVSGSGSLNKNGTGGLTLTGANTFTGSTVVNEGTLTLAGAGSNISLGSTSSVTVSTGATLALGASNQINNVADLVLDGGTFFKGNFSEGTASSVGLGNLSLTVDSHVDFGIGTTGTLTFSNFIPNTNMLVIDNWTGTANTVGSSSTDRLIFFSDQSLNLSFFSFTGYTGATEFNLGGGYFEIAPLAPVPEMNPAMVASLMTAVAAIVAMLRKRSRRA